MSATKEDLREEFEVVAWHFKKKTTGDLTPPEGQAMREQIAKSFKAIEALTNAATTQVLSEALLISKAKAAHTLDQYQRALETQIAIIRGKLS